MRLVIKTTYSNVDDKWLKEYLDRMRNAEVLPGCREIVSELEKNRRAEFNSKDPTSEVVGRTEYIIFGDEQVGH